MKFSHESLLYLLWIVIPLGFLLWFALRRQKQRLLAFNSRYFDKTITRLPSTARMVFKSMLLALSAVLLIVALAGPKWGFEWREVKHNGLDIMIALDVSQSMMAEDFKPNRLERAKREILDLLDLAEGDRIGLLAFAGTAFVQCPLTMDYSATRMFINYLTPELIPLQGTALGEAVLLALDRLKESSPDNARGRAIIVMSDGEDQGEQVTAAIKRANDQGVKVYTIGLGTTAGAPIPDPKGGFKKDKGGNLILSKFSKNTLQRLASETGGKFVNSVAGDLDLQEIYFNGIRGLSDGELSEQSYRERVWYQRFQYFLLAAFFLLLFEGMTARTSPNASAANRQQKWHAKKLAGLIVLVVGSLGFHKTAAADVRSDAHEAFQKKEFNQAEKLFEQAEVDSPEDPSITYNKGVSQYKAGNFAGAIQSFKKSMESENQKLREVSQFNLGNAQVKAGKLKEAVETYENILKTKANDKNTAENLAYARKLLEQQQQQQNQQQQDDQNKEEKQDKEEEQQHQQNKDEQQQKQNEQQQDQQQENQQQNSQQATNQEQGEKDEQQAQNKQQESEQESGSEQQSEQEQQAANEKDNQDNSDNAQQGKPLERQNISEREAQRLLRSIDDKMAKYMVRPSNEELQKYRQHDVEKDW